MKSTGTSLWQSPNTAATNESGFNGIPAGLRNLIGSFFAISGDCIWWSSSEDDTVAWICKLNYNGSNSVIQFGTKPAGFSVRCVRD